MEILTIDAAVKEATFFKGKKRKSECDSIDLSKNWCFKISIPF